MLRSSIARATWEGWGVGGGGRVCVELGGAQGGHDGAQLNRARHLNDCRAADDRRTSGQAVCVRACVCARTPSMLQRRNSERPPALHRLAPLPSRSPALLPRPATPPHTHRPPPAAHLGLLQPPSRRVHCHATQKGARHGEQLQDAGGDCHGPALPVPSDELRVVLERKLLAIRAGRKLHLFHGVVGGWVGGCAAEEACSSGRPAEPPTPSPARAPAPSACPPLQSPRRSGWRLAART